MRASDTDSRFRHVPWRRALPAALSGILLTASFPPLNLWWLAWIALAPLLIAVKGMPPGKAFTLGLVAGMVHYLTLIYWIVVVLGHYGGLNVLLSVVPLLLLCAYLSLFPALFSLLYGLFGRRPLPALLCGACAWVGLEYVRTVFVTGFPWCLLGYSQYGNLHVIQIADLFGVYGVSFIIVLSNGAAFQLWERMVRKSVPFPKWETLLTALCIGLTLVYGHQRLAENERTDGTSRKTVKSAVIQGNIDQSIKWDPAHQSRTLDIYEGLTNGTTDFDPDLIVWPETAVPFFFQDQGDYGQRVIALAEASKSALLFGSPAYERTEGKLRYFNRAYLIDPEKRSVQHYDKVHLVPFGEYVPLKRFLSFIHRLVPAAGDFESGGQVRPLPLEGVSLGVLICFEAIFPDLARRVTGRGADILVNLTNDAWFGKTSAPHQHLCMAVFRAVENRRPLIRAANTGISATVLENGKIEASTPLFQEAVLTSTLRLPSPENTFYTRYGDLFARLSLLAALLGAVWGIWRRKRAKATNVK